MKTFSKILLIISLFSLNTFITEGQSIKKELNQIELMKQFIGTWEGEFGDSSLFRSENKQFGNGILSESSITTKGKLIESIIQLYGYDSKTDKFIIAELKESSQNIEICSTWFTSSNSGETVITTPDNAAFKFKFVFKTPDIIIQSAIKDDIVVSEIVLKRIK